MKRRVNKIIMASLFAAFACLFTFIYIPLPLGYANLGDVIVILGAFLLGPLYGVLAAGIGPALADLFMGYAMYIPGTFVIKALVALTFVILYRTFSRKFKANFVVFVLCAMLSECVMVGGYYLYESLLLGYGFAGAAASIYGNCMQGTVCAIIASVLHKPVSQLLANINK
ncbi:MAG: ECF transporter S component [Ruminococcaceae bacterium]|nr:ECF transporter S component [Oscillospiraceae bacterium]